MEVAQSTSIASRLSKFFLKDPKPFTTKRDLDWSAIKKFGAVGVGGAVVVLLLLPQPEPEQSIFHEKADPGSTGQVKAVEADPSQDTWNQLQQARVNVGAVPGSLDYLYQSASAGGGGGSGGRGSDRTASMVLTRGGMDSKTQLPPGSRIRVRLIEKSIVAGQAMPVICVTVTDYVHEDAVAIPEGSKLFGEVSLDDSSERALVSWRSIQFPDGRERQISAVGVGADGQIGVEGKVHSDALKNSIGQTITRFIGAYAEGSMQKGQLGASEGGHANGIKNAIAATAKDRTEAWAEDLRKERKWIELSSGMELVAVLNQAFQFRDPGVIYGR